MKRRHDIRSLPIPQSIAKHLIELFESERPIKYKDLLEKDPVWLNLDIDRICAHNVASNFREAMLCSWDWTRQANLPPDCYAYIMNSEYPMFFMEDPCHFIENYIVKYREGPDHHIRLCQACFERDLDFATSSYMHVYDHTVKRGHYTMTYFKDEKHWCANCVTKPLFTMLNLNLCKEMYHLHSRKRSPMFWSYMNDSSDDSDSDLFDLVPVKHPRTE